jgi:predicted alpha-1,2-mannosidase
MKKIVLVMVLTLAVLTAGAQNYAQTVNTLIGTKGAGLTSGYLFPGATYPHGMVQFTPSYFAKNAGFVINQASGGGCEHMGNCPTFPLKGELKASPDMIRNAKITVTEEEGHAGYYKAMVQDDVKAELTVTERTGMARYTWPSDDSKGTVIIGTGLAGNKITEAAAVITSPRTMQGYADGGSFCGLPTHYKVFFYAEFDRDAVATGTWKRKTLHPDADFAQGEYSGLYFTFDTSSDKQVQYRIGVSYVSVENAKQNLKAENSGWDFNAVRSACEKEWNRYLGKIEISGNNSADRVKQFYTHLYRAFIHPSVCSDVNGEYMGADFLVHKTNFKQYTQFSNWDTYRTQIQLLSILEPDVTSDIVTSHYDFAVQSGGSLPRWVMANIETGIMQGDPSSILISNAWAFGARNYDPKPIFDVMRRGAEVPGAKSQDQETRPHLKQYLEKGYCPASIQLEYTSADFAIAQFALHAAGDEFASWRYFHFARSWKNLWNPETKWLQSRNEDGSWKHQGDDWREATYKDYFWMVPYNIKGLVDLLGGNANAEKRLDEYFVRLDAGYGDEWFASGNEPSWGIPWVYNWIGMPWKTSHVLRRTLNEQYSSAVNGLPGNDDLGSMGAWYVWTCLGLYPAIPGIGGFTLNTPVFEKAVVHLPKADITITGGSERNIYTKSLKLNGEDFNSTWIPWERLSGGASLRYTVSSSPDKKWGTVNVPPSFE